MLDTATTFLQGQLSLKLSTHYPCSRLTNTGVTLLDTATTFL